MAELLSDQQIRDRLSELREWHRNGNDGKEIDREWQFKDFNNALKFVDKVGALAEEANHHPDIFLHDWNKVKLTLSSHKAGGLTENDFNLAGKINKISRNYA